MTSDRKKDHIDLAFESQTGVQFLDSRFEFEPMLSAHPGVEEILPTYFLGKNLNFPIWISSMTGGTQEASTINRNLAVLCHEFGLGMGLGSCRILLDDNTFLKDFDVREYIGDDLPLYANLGIAQIEQLLSDNQLYKIDKLIEKLRADGLIIHVNPLQEWLQPEGDRFIHSPLETIHSLLSLRSYPLIVKEVGQGMGPQSLKALLKLPLQAIELAGNGGTNFSKLELLRSDSDKQELFQSLAFVGHSAEQMVDYVNQIVDMDKFQPQCHQIIISGGIKDFLDGYYLLKKLNLPAVYGQASGFLRHARGKYEDLRNHAKGQIEGLKLAHAYLRIIRHE